MNDFVFDASDLMPTKIGANILWKMGTELVESGGTEEAIDKFMNEWEIAVNNYKNELLIE
jgi:hypothetical protein